MRVSGISSLLFLAVSATHVLAAPIPLDLSSIATSLKSVFTKQDAAASVAVVDPSAAIAKMEQSTGVVSPDIRKQVEAASVSSDAATASKAKAAITLQNAYIENQLVKVGAKGPTTVTQNKILDDVLADPSHPMYDAAQKAAVNDVKNNNAAATKTSKEAFSAILTKGGATKEVTNKAQAAATKDVVDNGDNALIASKVWFAGVQKSWLPSNKKIVAVADVLKNPQPATKSTKIVSKLGSNPYSDDSMAKLINAAKKKVPAKQN